jgi:hypothetical protein
MTDLEVQLTRIERWLRAESNEEERSTNERKVAVLRKLLASTNNGKQAVRSLAQMMLETSWAVESAAVDAQFASTSSVNVNESLGEICAALGTLERMAHDASPALAPRDAMIDVFGEEICEALHWRRGALVYMCCASRVRAVVTDDDADESDARVRPAIVAALMPCAHLIERALYEFQCMLFSRRLLWNEADADAAAAAHDVARLSAVGVFGDISILCLMYAGELAYWQVEFVDSAEPADAAAAAPPWHGLTMSDVEPLPAHPWLPPPSLSKRERAVWLLRRFLHVVGDALPAPARAGWQTARATELIAKLEARH